ncbi:MAG: AmmeMemoRadiSam system radical SAM enzyme [Deltaproteobacteria bacterium]|nr:AmmeMemoRadiSam system radical SAM enzyme [Deltaproteobacteria bacterium]
MRSRELLRPGVVRAGFVEQADAGQLRCVLCPRRCRLAEGQRGFCFVRGVEDGELSLMSYGRASGFCVDPIEKKPLSHFLPGSSVLSFGTAGCNLGCRFCQNWDLSKAREMDRLTDFASPEAVAEAALTANCASVAFTYNDPVIFAEYAMDTALACHDRGVRTVAVTAGYIEASARPAFFSEIDAVNVDLKAFTEQFYATLCFARLEPVLDTLRWLAHESETWLELTTLLIPGENDSGDELARLVDFVVEELGEDVPLHFSAYHPAFEFRSVGPTPASTLRRAREQAKAAGLHHVYTGNVHDPEGETSYCAECRGALIERDRYRLRSYRLDPLGRCPDCGAKLAGVFEGSSGAGHGERRRLQLTR